MLKISILFHPGLWGRLLYGGPLEACIDKVILAPTDQLAQDGIYETVITGGLSYEEIGWAQNEVKIAALLETMQGTGIKCKCKSDQDWEARECAQQPCVRQLLLEYTSKHLSDLNGDGRVTCDDLAILLYVGHLYKGPPVRITCSLFWYFYRRNVAFLKHSEGVDINTMDIALPFSHDKSPLQWNPGDKSSSLRELDDGLIRCKNGQCKYGFFGTQIERCNGVVECSDSSDEQDCKTCPKGTLTCLLSGIPTCLLESDFCRFSPERCHDGDGREVSLDKCAFSSEVEKWDACKEFADNYWRQHFGEFEDENNKPKISFRQMICRGNNQPVDKKMNLEEALSIVPSSIRDYKFLNYKQSICQDKVNTTSLFIVQKLENIYFRLTKALDPVWRTAMQMFFTKEGFSNVLTAPALTRTLYAPPHKQKIVKAARTKQWKYALKSTKSLVTGSLDTKVMCMHRMQILSSRAPPKLDNSSIRNW